MSTTAMRRVARVACAFAVLMMMMTSMASGRVERSTTTLSCAECRAVARAMAAKLRALERFDDDDALRLALGASSRGRRMTHGRSELEVARVVDDACEDDGVEGLGAASTRARCRAAFGAKAARDAIENEAFAHGPRDIERFACEDATGCCDGATDDDDDDDARDEL